MSQRPILLASGSPRRRVLLTQVGFAPTVAVGHSEEIWPPLPPALAAAKVAEDKLVAARARHQAALDPQHDALWVAADTVVVVGERICGKPVSEATAVAMLLLLAGKTHQVVTGFAVARGQQVLCRSCTTNVTFRAFGRAEAEAYARTGEALDKSGAYAIQGGGTALAARIDGSLSNIVGLPVAEVLAALEEVGDSWA